MTGDPAGPLGTPTPIHGALCRPETGTIDRPPSWPGAAVLDGDLGEVIDLTVANGARLAIYRLLDQLLRDPFDTAAAAELVQTQETLRPDICSAQNRQSSRRKGVR